MTGCANSLAWSRLHLPAPLTPEAATAAVQALAGVSGQPRVVLEALGRRGAVQWRLGTEPAVHTRVVQALRPHLPGLRIELSQGPADSVALAARLHLPGHRSTPLNVDRVEPVTRGLLAAMAATRRGEFVRLQVVLGDRRQPRRVRVDGVGAPERRDVTRKHSEHRFGAVVRLAAAAGDVARARSLIGGVVAALRGLEAPGVRVVLRRITVRKVEAVASPLIWPLELGVSEVATLLAWPIASDKAPQLPGVPNRHPVLLPPSLRVPRTGRLLGRATTDASRTVALGVEDSLRHLHLLGPTGVGKSTLMARLALGDMAAGHGVVVIDPKGDLVEDLLARIPAKRVEDVVVLDPTDHAPVGLAALGTPASADLTADGLLAVFHSLYADSWGPRTHDLLGSLLLTLARRGDASLAMVPMLLTHQGFRRSVTRTVAQADPMGLGTFWGWYDAISDGERAQAIAPLMNKLRPVLLRPGLRAVLGQRRPAFALRDVFTKRRILLVSLAKGRLGPECAQLLGSLVVALLWQAAQERAAVSPRARRPVFIHIDEVQDYLRLPGDLGDALAQARGLGVGFTLAHQHLDQLPRTLRTGVLANARSRVTFQLSPDDARTLAGASHGQLMPEDFATLPAFHAYAQLLVDGAQVPWCSLHTEPLPAATASSEVVRETSRRRYGQAISEVERDLLGLVQPGSEDQVPLGRSRPGQRPGGVS